MPQDDDYDDDQDEGQQQPENFRRTLERQSKAATKRAEEAEARASAAERKLAFAEAGIKLDDPKAKWFVKGYDGELTAEAIKAEATAAGYLSGEPAGDIPAEERAAHERMAQSAAGTSVAGGRDFDAEMRAAANDPERIMQLAREKGTAVV